MDSPHISEPLAHSARNGASEADISRACRQCVPLRGAIRSMMRRHFRPSGASRWWRQLIRLPHIHDLGKLDEQFSGCLAPQSRGGSNRGLQTLGCRCCNSISLAVQSNSRLHSLPMHTTLACLRSPAEKAKLANGLNLVCRDESVIDELAKPSGSARTNFWKGTLLVTTPSSASHTEPECIFHTSGLVRCGSLALSSLVDGDHSDTAQHYRNERELVGLPLCPAERLAALDKYVASLAASTPFASERERKWLEIRQQIYQACQQRQLTSNERIVACDSPVGTGKTTAVMAHLLNIAQQRGLRRVFVVLPFTNIIDQSVDVYRCSLVLKGESPEDVVAAHHHRVEFKGENWRDLRQLTQRWDAPVVVTTAVQFFETLAAKDTTALRKLHQVPGSAIFVDEAHAAMPAPLWPQMFRWLRELCDD